jgi:hypothetical protein
MASKVPMEAIEEEKPVWFEDPRKAGANEYVPCLSYNSKPLAKPRRNSLGGFAKLLKITICYPAFGLYKTIR